MWRFLFSCVPIEAENKPSYISRRQYMYFHLFADNSASLVIEKKCSKSDMRHDRLCSLYNRHAVLN